MSISSTIAAATTTTILLLLTLTSGNPPPQPFHKIFAFGDSYTDTGNTASATGPSGFSHVSNLPYGRTFFHHPTNRLSEMRIIYSVGASM
ncbi:putative sinapine esterase [Helianthus annuus]|nr:putative sinapine esterase [Helianthus annuus]